MSHPMRGLLAGEPASTPAPQTSPLHVAWAATGSAPAPHAGVAIGSCARCNAPDRLTPVRSVVSRGFGDLDHWVNPTGDGLCSACTWAFRATELRARPHLIDADPAAVTPLTWGMLAQLLADPLPSTRAITVPSRPGRRHVLPNAHWGRVVLDDLALTWTTDDAARLATVAALRAAGMPSAAFAQPAPPWTFAQRLSSSAERADLLTAWSQLEPWREARPWLTVGLLAANTGRA